MDISYKLAIFFLRGVVYVPLYAVLFCHFLKYMAVTNKVWKRAFILAIAAYFIVTTLGIVFGVFSHAWIGQFLGALAMAYLLTKILFVSYYNAAIAAILIVIIGQDISPMIINFVNENVIS